MRFAWVGFHAEGIPALEALLAAGAPVAGVLTLTPELAARRSGGADYGAVCARYDVPLHYVANINDPASLTLLRRLAPDVVFVIGWGQIVHAPALRLARVGMIGAHASLLPHNRGSAPVNWALIRGETETGNTLFWLDEAVDTGPIIDQTRIPITPYDTCATIYERVAASNRDMIQRVLPRLFAGERPAQPQTAGSEPPLPRRRPADGQIDWEQPSRVIYDFVRALTRPYPGAFSTLDDTRWHVWQAAVLPPGLMGGPTTCPGQVVGAAIATEPAACGQVVACGHGALLVLDLEADDGTRLRGPALSEQPWAGKRWTDG